MPQKVAHAVNNVSDHNPNAIVDVLSVIAGPFVGGTNARVERLLVQDIGNLWLITFKFEFTRASVNKD